MSSIDNWVAGFARSVEFRPTLDGKGFSFSELPDMLTIQHNSYNAFLYGTDCDQVGNNDSGLFSVFRSVFSIVDVNNKAALDFVSYTLDKPRLDPDESMKRGITYSATLRAVVRLVIWGADEVTGMKEFKGIKEQDVYICDIPLMTSRGTFVINGCEYVVVSQVHRSPGVFFDHDKGKTHASGKFLYSARVIPYRGSWLDFEFDAKDLLYFRIDRKRKVLVTTLMFALGFDKQSIIDLFYDKINVYYKDGSWRINLNLRGYIGFRMPFTLLSAKDGALALKRNARINHRVLTKLSLNGNDKGEFIVSLDDGVSNLFLASTLSGVEAATDESSVVMEVGSALDDAAFTLFSTVGVTAFDFLVVDDTYAGNYVLNTMKADRNTCADEALVEIYKVMRPGDPASAEMGKSLLHSFFFDVNKYDLSNVGRVKLNAKLSLDLPESCGILTTADIVGVVRCLIAVKDGRMDVDDIDHLGNRRVKSVGELVENQFRLGLVRVARAALERLAAVDLETVMPHDLINSKLLTSLIREFFSASQLSQFMDQTNPLSEITHKRRLSTLGPGGLTRERAGYEVRDVHTTHYGRVCPIETPEGQNIGLINSLAIYASINKYGFIEAPYYKVIDGRLTKEVHYLSAIEEVKYNLAQANILTDSEGHILEELIQCRRNGEFVMVYRHEVDYVDVSPKQVVSVAASLIPFLENDDANRALMGSNMQRQAVPLVLPAAPFVGTGMECVVARDSKTVVSALRDGVVRWVDSTAIVVESSDSVGEIDVYKLQKFRRSNYNTLINQRPAVSVGDVLIKGDLVADGAATDNGELALGQNVLVAFIPWRGTNFEDSIAVSENIVRADAFTSIHIEEFECTARDTRLGPEEITRDIPNVSEERMAYLDESGIINIGVEVEAGDVLVGKVTPKSESPMTPEEKLLRTIFGEKAADVRDSSLYVPPGIKGVVIDVRVFSLHGTEKCERQKLIERDRINEAVLAYNVQISVIEESFCARLSKLLLEQTLAKPYGTLVAGDVLGVDVLSAISSKDYWLLSVQDSAIQAKIEELHSEFNKLKGNLLLELEESKDKIVTSCDLPQGVLKFIKVFVAVKSRLQPGDKMAGRHGNKGVVSKILPIEDMPCLENGRNVDIILNPLGVPSRMNVGQILETHLGWVCGKVCERFASVLSAVHKGSIEILRDMLRNIYSEASVQQKINTLSDEDVLALANVLKDKFNVAAPVFESPSEKRMDDFVSSLGIDPIELGPARLMDGMTGEYFDRPVTVGYIYMMKLHHLVDNKIHARSVGPYSLITQQPLGGKSHFGGQRFGEMECWALQAYGAAHTLQEMLTIKSDDVTGRVRVYESIVRGDSNLEYGMPESFNVMIKELRSLCLNVELYDGSD